jgi:hypothetical protein
MGRTHRFSPTICNVNIYRDRPTCLSHSDYIWLFRNYDQALFNYKSLVIPFSKNYSALALADKLPVAQVSITIMHYEIWKMVLETFSWVEERNPTSYVNSQGKNECQIFVTFPVEILYTKCNSSKY